MMKATQSWLVVARRRAGKLTMRVVVVLCQTSQPGEGGTVDVIARQLFLTWVVFIVVEHYV